MDDNKDRLANEAAFHDARFSSGDTLRRSVEKYYAATDSAKSCYRERATRRCIGASLLEYGCGTGSDFRRWLEAGAVVTGIDISPAAVDLAAASAEDAGLAVSFKVMNAENLEFSDETFNLVVGTGIIHHLDLRKAFSELRRVLKPDGAAIFFEPMGHNALINLYRRLTPRLRTVDEHPLLMRDISLAKQYFSSVEAEFFVLTSLLAVPFRRLKGGAALLSFLEKLDTLILRVCPWMRRFCWIVVIELRR